MVKNLALVIVFAFCIPTAAQETSVENLLSQSDPAIQKKLGDVYDALKKSPREDSLNNPEVRQAVAALKDAVADERQIAKQVAIFAAGPDEQQPLLALAVLQALDLPPGVVIGSLSPHLDADNVKVRSFVRDWFQNYDNGGSDESPLKRVNFEDYADYARKKLQRKENIPEGFVGYLFERSPGRALLIFNLADRHGEIVDRLKAMRRELDQRESVSPRGPPLPPAKEGLGRREILLAEHLISDTIWLHKNKFDEQFQAALPEAMAELEKLASHKQWWARLYVVHIMRRHPELLQDHILRKLAEDENELVSKAAERRAAPNPGDGKRAKPPVAPSDVNARALGPTTGEVTWQASVGATIYKVLRRQPDTETEYKVIAPNVTGTSFIATGLAKDTLYQYRVIAGRNP